MLKVVNEQYVYRIESEKVPTLVTYLGWFDKGKFIQEEEKRFITADNKIIQASKYVFQTTNDQTETIYTPNENVSFGNADTIRQYFQPKMGDVYKYNDMKIIISIVDTNNFSFILDKNDTHEFEYDLLINTRYIATYDNTIDILQLEKLNDPEKYVYMPERNKLPIKQGKKFKTSDTTTLEIVRCDQWPVEMLMNNVTICWLAPCGRVFSTDTCAGYQFRCGLASKMYEIEKRFNFKGATDKYYNFTFSNEETKCCYTYYVGETQTLEILGLQYQGKTFGYLTNDGSVYKDCSMVHKMNFTLVDMTFSHIEMRVGYTKLVPKQGDIWEETFDDETFAFEILTDTEFPIKIRYLDSKNEFLVDRGGCFQEPYPLSNYYLQNVKKRGASVVEVESTAVVTSQQAKAIVTSQQAETVVTSQQAEAVVTSQQAKAIVTSQQTKAIVTSQPVVVKDNKKCWRVVFHGHYQLIYVVASEEPKTVKEALDAIPKFAHKLADYLAKQATGFMTREEIPNSKYAAYYRNGDGYDTVEFESPYRVSVSMFHNELMPTNYANIEELVKDLPKKPDIVEYLGDGAVPWIHTQFEELVQEEYQTNNEIRSLRAQISELEKQINTKNIEMEHKWNKNTYFSYFKDVYKNLDSVVYNVPEIVKAQLRICFKKQYDSCIFSDHQRLAGILEKLK